MNGVARVTNRGVRSTDSKTGTDRSGISKIPIGWRAAVVSRRMAVASFGLKWWNELKIVRKPRKSAGTERASTDRWVKETAPPEPAAACSSAGTSGNLSVSVKCTPSPRAERARHRSGTGPAAPEQRSMTRCDCVASRAAARGSIIRSVQAERGLDEADVIGREVPDDGREPPLILQLEQVEPRKCHVDARRRTHRVSCEPAPWPRWPHYRDTEPARFARQRGQPAR